MSKAIKRRLRDIEQKLAPQADPLKGMVIYDPEEGADKAEERFFRENPDYEGALFLIPDNGRGRHDSDDQ